MYLWKITYAERMKFYIKIYIKKIKQLAAVFNIYQRSRNFLKIFIHLYFYIFPGFSSCRDTIYKAEY